MKFRNGPGSAGLVVWFSLRVHSKFICERSPVQTRGRAKDFLNFSSRNGVCICISQRTIQSKKLSQSISGVFLLFFHFFYIYFNPRYVPWWGLGAKYSVTYRAFWSYVATFPNSQLSTFNFTHRFLGLTLAEMEGNKKRRSNNESLDPKSIKKSKVCAPIPVSK